LDERCGERLVLRDRHGGVPPGSINSLVEGDDGDLWVGTDTGIVRIPQVHLVDPSLEALTSYRLGDEQSDEILALLKTADGGILAGTNHGLYRFDGSRFAAALTSVYVSRITQLRSGRVLLITGEGPAEYVGPSKLEYLHVGSRFGVADKEIYDIFEDREGGVWFCTNHGVLPLGGSKPHPLQPDGPGTTQTFRGTRGPDGTMWVSTGIGAYAIEDGHHGAAVLLPTGRLHHC
jgi:ligand-binding sensor domain-containing protein